MSDRSREAADQAVAYLMEVSPLMRGCAIFDPRGGVVAATGEPDAWREPGSAFIEAVDSTPVAGGSATHGHVATGQGEVFVVCEEDFHAVAVFDRFCLASLVFFDLRAAIRDIREADGAITATSSEAGD